MDTEGPLGRDIIPNAILDGPMDPPDRSIPFNAYEWVDAKADEYCYLCETKESNPARMAMMDMIRRAGDMQCRYLCLCVARYYENDIREHLPGNPAFTASQVFRHITRHKVDDAQLVLIKNLWNYAEYDEMFCKNVRRVDTQTEIEKLPTLEEVKCHMEIMKQRSADALRLQNLRAARKA
jgi:hypothetical protein